MPCYRRFRALPGKIAPKKVLLEPFCKEAEADLAEDVDLEKDASQELARLSAND